MSGQPVLAAAARILAAGGLVAYPTETYYGLAADPWQPAALERLFTLKARPAAKPILTIIAEAEQIALLASAVPEPFRPLMAAFWPGPLTLLFPVRPELPAALTAGTGTVGIRLSSHPLARSLAAACGGPITATSANRTGQPAAASAAEVRAAFPDGLDLVLDGGPTPGGAGSTVVGLAAGRLQVVRPGVIPAAAVLGRGGQAAPGGLWEP
ncbi:MAG: L-threonylcarbamoyladenylate synthase [Thermodesulfobacteriota bacterium]